MMERKIEMRRQGPPMNSDSVGFVDHVHLP